jgi:hypothetical protein
MLSRVILVKPHAYFTLGHNQQLQTNVSEIIMPDCCSLLY